MASQGERANRSGNVLERTVVATMQALGFSVVNFKDYTRSPNEFGTELLLRNVPYTTLYGGRGYTEFLIVSKVHNQNVRVECKWQQSAGSVDEKLPHLYLSCIEAMPQNHVIILIDGKGFRDGAIVWLRKAATERRYLPADSQKLVQVMSVAEFLTWANSTF